MNEKLQKMIDEMMKSLGFNFSEEERQQFRGKEIIVVDDDTGEVVEVSREASEDAEGVNTE